MLPTNKLRNYNIDSRQHKLYIDMYKNQTYDFIIKKRKHYSNLNRYKKTVKEALKMLDNFIDPSDPDLDVPNSIHAYQTAERIRKKFPENKEFQIIGLIHDLGKILYTFGEPDWAVVGDTYLLGCEFPSSIIFYDEIINSPEYKKYDKNGLYKDRCGLDNLIISYGHDEYLYNVLKNNTNHKISHRYINIIRYHSFYPWHSKNEYRRFMKSSDYQILYDIKLFNEFDLYSKEDNITISDSVKEYYNKILDEYFIGPLSW